MAYLSRLVLTNFRSLVELDLALPPGVVVFFGDNAQGKTTLLEAAYLLAIGRSFRAEAEREVINLPAAARGESAVAGGTIQRGEPPRPVVVYVGFRPIGPTGAGAAAGDAPALSGKAGRLRYSVHKEVRIGRTPDASGPPTWWACWARCSSAPRICSWCRGRPADAGAIWTSWCPRPTRCT